MKQIIVITGGSDGLGKKLAAGLSKNNQVIILSPTKAKLESVVKQLGCDYVVADVAKPESIENAVKTVIDKYGRVDCLINNAGVWIQGQIEDNDYDSIQKAIEVNALGTIFSTKAVVPEMKKNKSGLIINVISQAGLYGKGERSVYNASKWAITGFTKSIQAELAPFGIRVTGLYPGMMRTEMFQKMGIKKEMANGIDTDEVLSAVNFLLSTDKNTMIPELGIKNINN